MQEAYLIHMVAGVLKSGKNVVVSHTFVRNAAMALYFALARQVGALVRVLDRGHHRRIV
jgi:hypothetical protein